MQRANHVRVGECDSQKKSPAVRDAGPFKHRLADRAIGGDLSAAILNVAQARSAVANIIWVQRVLSFLAAEGGDAIGAAAKMRPTLQRAYEAAWAVYEAAGPSGIGDAFEEIFGVEFGDLESALEGVGWLIAEPTTRAAIGSSRHFYITPEGVRANV